MLVAFRGNYSELLFQQAVCYMHYMQHLIDTYLYIYIFILIPFSEESYSFMISSTNKVMAFHVVKELNT